MIVPLAFGPAGWWKPVLALVVLALLIYGLMWWGWRRRSRKHDLPELLWLDEGRQVVGTTARGRYFGSTVHGDWLDRVVAQGLGNRSDVTIVLHDEGLDVRRPGLRGFRIPADALRSAGTASGIAGKVIPPHGVLVVTWAWGGLTLDSGFNLDTGGHDAWAAEINKHVKETA